MTSVNLVALVEPNFQIQLPPSRYHMKLLTQFLPFVFIPLAMYVFLVSCSLEKAK